MNKFQTLKGFRDFLPNEKRVRDFALSKIKTTFERFGFEAIETPTLEPADLLLGKYGTEADKLVYTFKDKGDRNVGLRYDQTVPTARILGQYQDKLQKGFRRYQIQNVFRADKPQKGRFREFTQCDIDIFGVSSALADCEILSCSYYAFKELGFSPKILINDREVLISVLSKYQTDKVDVFSLIQSIDKLDKVPESEIVNELSRKGVSKLNALRALDDLKKAEASDNLKTILGLLESYGIDSSQVIFTPYLARGLDYYTKTIFEIKVDGLEFGSLAGGGRYDNLIKQLGGPDTPAVGIAFGFDRIIQAIIDLNLLPSDLNNIQSALVTIFSKDLVNKSIKVAMDLRLKGINVEIYPDETAKLEKQLKYADRKQIPYVIIIGEDEISKKRVLLKNLKTKEQNLFTIDEICKLLQG